MSGEVSSTDVTGYRNPSPGQWSAHRQRQLPGRLQCPHRGAELHERVGERSERAQAKLGVAVDDALRTPERRSRQDEARSRPRLPRIDPRWSAGEAAPTAHAHKRLIRARLHTGAE
jgi:hypothetical protein